MEVKCVKRCFDSNKCRRYWPGDVDDIDPSDPIAMYFTGWPQGTEVYKKPAAQVAPAAPAAQVAPAAPAVPEAPVAPAAPEAPYVPVANADGVFECDICGALWPTAMAASTHRRHCAKKPPVVPEQ